jgi:hypothetical protein
MLSAGHVAWPGLADDHCGRPLTDLNDAVLGQRDKRVPDSSRFQPLDPGEVGHRRQGVAWGQLPGADRCPHTIRGLLPFEPGVGRVGPQVWYVAMLGERLAGARQVPASHQAGVEPVQQRAADLAHLHGPEGWFDGPPDVPEVAFPGGQLPPGDLHVLLQ